jgi:hypothetical protein
MTPPTPIQTDPAHDRSTDVAPRLTTAEAALDRRVAALSRALLALGELGDGDAEDLHEVLFPDGLRVEVEPVGDAQRARSALLADRIAAHAGAAARARLEPHLSRLEADLRRFAAGA